MFLYNYKPLYDWLSLKWKTFFDKIRVFAVLTLFISICLTGYTSLILNSLRENFLVINNLFCQDLGIIIGSKIVDIIDLNNYKQLLSFIEKIYISTSSIRYILLFDADGTLFISIPSYSDKIQNLLQFHQNLLQLETHDFLFNTPLVKYNTLFNDNITDILIPLTKNGYTIASLEIGITSNSIIYTSLNFINIISLIIFILIWVFSFIISFINYIIFNLSIDSIIEGINNILLGNFNYKMKLTRNKKVNSLVFKFNEMAEKLQYYEEQNINRLNIEKSKLELIVAIIEYGIIILDSELRILLINEMANKAVCCGKQDLVGKFICDYLPLHITEVLLPILNDLIQYNCFNNKYYKNKEICLHINNDIQAVLRFIIKIIVDKDNSMLVGIVIVVKDVSQEVNLDETKNHFMSNISHELRTPLCNISSFLETLLDYNDTLLENRKIQFLKLANHETKRLSTLVNDILDLSRVDANASYLLANVDIGLILKYIVNIFQIIADTNNIKLILEIDPSIQYVLAHESSLCQVLSNLLSNSIKFTNHNSYILIRVYSVVSIPINHCIVFRLNNQNNSKLNIVRIEIIDEGIGIDKVNQAIIFHRFMRIENNIHTLQGTGLGLSIVKNILNKYETKIYVNSLLNVGTSLCFDLVQVS